MHHYVLSKKMLFNILKTFIDRRYDKSYILIILTLKFMLNDAMFFMVVKTGN